MATPKNSQSSAQKYRPVLTGQQISHLITLCKRDGSRDSLSCLSQLCLYEYKIQNELTKPAYTLSPKESLESQLGFSEGFSDSALPSQEEFNAGFEALYNQWLESPQNLTISQISLVHQYRYENNKMTVDEEKKFESEVLGI